MNKKKHFSEVPDWWFYYHPITGEKFRNTISKKLTAKPKKYKKDEYLHDKFR